MVVTQTEPERNAFVRYYDISEAEIRVVSWLIWAVTLLAVWSSPLVSEGWASLTGERLVLSGVVLSEPSQQRGSFPWSPRVRFRKWALKRYRRLREAHRRAVRAARWSRMVLGGTLSLARLVDWVTQSQLAL